MNINSIESFSNFEKMFYYLSYLIILLPTITKCDDSVHILSSSYQLVTSSTLRWLPYSQRDTRENKDLVIGGEKFVDQKIEGKRCQ